MYRQFVYVKNDVFICCFKSISAVILMQQIYLSPLVMCVVNLHLEIRNATNDLQVFQRISSSEKFCHCIAQSPRKQKDYPAGEIRIPATSVFKARKIPMSA